MTGRGDETLPPLPVFPSHLYGPESLATFPWVLPLFPPLLADECISTESSACDPRAGKAISGS